MKITEYLVQACSELGWDKMWTVWGYKRTGFINSNIEDFLEVFQVHCDLVLHKWVDGWMARWRNGWMRCLVAYSHLSTPLATWQVHGFCEFTLNVHDKQSSFRLPGDTRENVLQKVIIPGQKYREI